MSKVRAKNTAPEMTVRRLVHALGFRYRLHGKSLPGSPDLVFSGRGCVIFVHGCFWHLHECRAVSVPASNRDYWVAKLERNRRRDRRNEARLRALGWRVMTVWECQLKNPDRLARRVVRFLNAERP